MASTALHTAIMTLSHSGGRGFEGLVADLLSAVTGLNFATQKSGSQKGTDALASTFKIGLEGKQYKESTPLALDALKAKLVEAVTTNPELELWILATTRSVDPLDIRALKELAATYGAEALVLAWDVGAFRIPPLALLCAMAPAALTAHIGANPAITAELTAIVKNPDFTAQSQRLAEDLKAADIGYGATRANLTRWHMAQMADVRCARVAFDSEANILASSNHRIGRPTVSKKLEEWWHTTNNSGIILGEEGMGKTWAALGWWADHADKADRPLCIIIPARHVDSENGPRLVSEAIHKATKLRDPEFWEKRVERWLVGPAGKIQIIIIIDGLNQNWSFTRWSQVILSLTAGSWQDRARILMTCRPDHWVGKLRALADLQPNPTSISIGQFDDGELSSLLKSYSLDKEWDPAIKALIRVPRLCHVAVRRHDDLATTGDITIERLIYEDWRHRSASARLAWSEAEFRNFIVGLATKLRAGAFDDTQTRAELIARVTQSSGAETTDAPPILSEIIDGGWMESVGKPHELRVRKSRVPPVLGLALLNELSATINQDYADTMIAVALEPYQGNDISVAILRYAATFSLMDANAPDHVRVALTKHWLSAQNFSGEDFAALWPLIGANPEILLDCVEQIWFGFNPQGREDEVIVKSFSNAVRWPIVTNALSARMSNWLSRYWLDPLVGAVISQINDDEAARDRRSATAARAEAWQTAGGPAATGITPVLTEDASWGRARATELLSWLPRADYIQAIKAWAVTTAIIGPPTPVYRMAWALRWNETDGLETQAALLDVAEALFTHGHAVSCDAAVKLLEALATPRALAASAKHSTPEILVDHLSVYAVTVQQNTITWDPEAAMQWPRVQENLLDATVGLEPLAEDPNLYLAESDILALRALAQRAYHKFNLDADSGNYLNRNIRQLPLARWAQQELALFVRRQFAFPTPVTLPIHQPTSAAMTHRWRTWLWNWARSAFKAAHAKKSILTPENFDADSPAIKLAAELPKGAILLSETELLPWRKLARAQRLTSSADQKITSALHVVSLARLSSRAQVEVLLEWPLGPPFPEAFAQALQPFSTAEFNTIASCLHPSASDQQLGNWLSLLTKIDVSAMPRGWPVIAALFSHQTPGIRALAMQVAYDTDDLVLADFHEASGWSCNITATPRDAGDEGAYGSLLLAQSSAAANNSAIASRVHGEVLGELAEKYPDQPIYLDKFANYVETELNHYLTASSTSYPRGLLSNVRGWTAFVERQPDRLRSALEPWISGRSRRFSFFMIEKFPIYDAIDALATIDPVAASCLIKSELERQLNGIMRSGTMFAAAMSLPDLMGDDARDLLLNQATDDYKIQELVNLASRHNKLSWIKNRITTDLASSCTAFIARGMVLAAFLPANDETEALWACELAAPPGPGWLAQVHATAFSRFNRQRRARYWFDAFMSTNEPETIYATLQLFSNAVDSRIYSSSTLRPSVQDLTSWPAFKRTHWHWNWDLVKSAIKQDQDSLKQSLLFSLPPGHAQYPKMR